MTFVIQNPPNDSRRFVDLQNEVLNYGFSDGPQVNRGRIKTWLNEGQHHIARTVEDSAFQEVNTITTIGGTASYTLPTDFLRIQTVAFPSLAGRLRPIDLDQLDSVDSTIQGPPQMYTIFQQSVVLFPTPDAVYTLNMRYVGNPTEMVADGDFPVLPPNYWDLLITYATYRAFAAEDDYEAAGFWQQTYEKELARYATDANSQVIDRPRVIDGSWASGGYGGRVV